MKARYCGVVVGLFLQAVGASALGAPAVPNAVVTTVNPGAPGSVVAPATVPAARAAAAVAGAPRPSPVAQIAPAAIAPAALTAEGAELEDESGMFGGGESQVLSVVPSQDVAPA